jgi:predicted DNA binding protein
VKFQKMVLAPKSEGGNNLFLKIQDGKSVNAVLRGEIYQFYSRWVDNRSEVVTADAEGARKRFRVNAIVEEDGRLVAKIWEFVTSVYVDLAALNEDYPIETTKVKISRRGTGKETNYQVIPVPPKEQLTERQLKQLESVPLNALEHRDSAQAKASGGDTTNEFGF